MRNPNLSSLCLNEKLLELRMLILTYIQIRVWVALASLVSFIAVLGNKVFEGK